MLTTEEEDHGIVCTTELYGTTEEKSRQAFTCSDCPLCPPLPPAEPPPPPPLPTFRTAYPPPSLPPPHPTPEPTCRLSRDGRVGERQLRQGLPTGAAGGKLRPAGRAREAQGRALRGLRHRHASRQGIRRGACFVDAGDNRPRFPRTSCLR